MIPMTGVSFFYTMAIIASLTNQPYGVIGQSFDDIPGYAAEIEGFAGAGASMTTVS